MQLSPNVTREMNNCLLFFELMSSLLACYNGLHLTSSTGWYFTLHQNRHGIPVNTNNIVWLASYPRSGNTFLRTVLWQCFGLPSASYYPNDLGGKKALEEYVGHIERESNNEIRFPKNSIPLVKTHEYPTDEFPAIYVVRDGLAASVSLFEFYKGGIPLRSIIEGQSRFGTWANHVKAWKPWERSNTLLLKYEDMKDDLSGTTEKISTFLKRDILKQSIPDRNTIAAADGRWVKREGSSGVTMTDDTLEKFHQLNDDMLRKMGYLNRP